MNTEITVTPRTDKAVFSHMEDYLAIEEVIKVSRQLEIELAQIRKALGDNGQRSHKELLELSRNASSWKTWRQKYRDLDMGVRCEYCDPAGTIWECCKDRNKRTDEEINKLKEKIEYLESEAPKWKIQNSDQTFITIDAFFNFRRIWKDKITHLEKMLNGK
jgi:DNA-binding transcriptional MerR regulator